MTPVELLSPDFKNSHATRHTGSYKYNGKPASSKAGLVQDSLAGGLKLLLVSNLGNHI